MSVVNQMLRDLERQDPKADLFETASATEHQQNRPFSFWMVLFLTICLIATFVYFGFIEERLTNGSQKLSSQPPRTLTENQNGVAQKAESGLKDEAFSKVSTQANLNKTSELVDDHAVAKSAETAPATQDKTSSKPEENIAAMKRSVSPKSTGGKVVSGQEEVLVKQQQVEKPVEDSKPKSIAEPKPKPEIVATESSQNQSNIRQLSEKQIKKEKLQKATNMIAQGLWGAAEKHLIEITKAHPDYHAAIEKLAYVYIQTSNDSALKALLESSILAHPGHLNYRILLARQYAEAKQWNMVISVASPITQPHKTLSVMQAIAHQQLDQHQRAVAIYVELLKRFPERGEWWMGLSISLESLKRPKDAHQALVKASNDPRLTQQQSQYIGQKLKHLEGQF